MLKREAHAPPFPLSPPRLSRGSGATRAYAFGPWMPGTRPGMTGSRLVRRLCTKHRHVTPRLSRGSRATRACACGPWMPSTRPGMTSLCTERRHRPPTRITSPWGEVGVASATLGEGCNIPISQCASSPSPHPSPDGRGSRKPERISEPAAPECVDRHFGDGVAGPGVDHVRARGGDGAVLGRRRARHAKQKHVARGEFARRDLDQVPPRGVAQRFFARGFRPIEGIGGRHFGLFAHNAAPHPPQQPQAIAAHALEARLVVIRRGKPASRLGHNGALQRRGFARKVCA